MRGFKAKKRGRYCMNGRHMVLNAITGYLLVMIPVVDSAQEIRGVPEVLPGNAHRPRRGRNHVSGDFLPTASSTVSQEVCCHGLRSTRRSRHASVWRSRTGPLRRALRESDLATIQRDKSAANSTDEHGNTQMHRAAQAEDTADSAAFLKFLLDVGAALDVPNHLGFTPVYVTLFRNHGYTYARPRWGLFELLLARGAPYDINLACVKGDIDKVRALLAADPAAVHLKAPCKKRPLSCAVKFGRLDLVALLLAAGADPNAQEADGYLTFPLVAAAKHNDLAMVKMLLEHGADPNAQTYGAEVARPRNPLTDPPSGGLIEKQAPGCFLIRGSTSAAAVRPAGEPSSASPQVAWSCRRRPGIELVFAPFAKDYIDASSCRMPGPSLGGVYRWLPGPGRRADVFHAGTGAGPGPG
jgi:hypothetical protein